MKRLIAPMLCMFITLTGCARHDRILRLEPETFTPAVAEHTGVTYEPEDPPFVSFRYGRSLMEGEMAALYDSIQDFLSSTIAGDTMIPVGNELTENEIAYTITIFQRENPIYYWAELSVNGRYINVSSKIPPDEVLEQRQAIETRAALILEPIKSASPFEIALAIHDALGTIPYSNDESQPDRDNLYGTLVNNEAICGGYASAYLYLTELAGLESVFLAGESERGISHAWNAVRLDEAWHFVDITWNRPNDKFGNVRHAYFLIDTETLKIGRYWDENQYTIMPDPGEGFRDYYQRRGCSVSGETTFDAVEIMADIFYQQLVTTQSFPAAAQAINLELRVSDSPEVYAQWKDLFIKHLFDILRIVHTKALEEDANFIVANLDRVSCDYNDIAHILMFYPIIKGR